VRLRVSQAKSEDVYRDIVRIPEKYRLGHDGRLIPEGDICEIRVSSDKRAYAIVRGLQEENEPIVRMDERLRNMLGVSLGDEVELVLKRVGLWGQFWWAWNASDPAYRVMARVSLLSVGLAVLALFLGIVSLLR